MHDTFDSRSAQGQRYFNQSRYAPNYHLPQQSFRYGSLNSFYKKYSLDSILEDRETGFGNVSSVVFKVFKLKSH